MANDFLVFGGGAGANVISQVTYSGLAARTAGFSSGVAQSAQLNKVWRQSSIMAAVLAQFISDRSGQDVLDDGTTATILANLKASAATVNGDVTKTFSVAPATASTHAAQLSQVGFRNQAVYRRIAGVQQVSINGGAFTTTGATTFAAPTGGMAKYRIWGAGGGGGGSAGGAGALGGGGGGGGYVEGIVSGLLSATAITVGAGGSGGTNAPTSGSQGGTSSFGAIASAFGGSGGQAQNGVGGGTPGSGSGGSGGMLIIPGTAGGSGYSLGSAAISGAGGGSFGTTSFQGPVSTGSSGFPGIFPGGGATGTNNANATAGADGLVIVEY
ncbi:phage tail protein [Cupriavidus pauculus]|uniref:glycine-rich domain-containing protein n=1 Tax=Cupriavidus pauculus TaxID=82633 RepID=UPI001C935786|nr:phage tail protein [Cupriavidus pauculus]MBY4733998.1 phage tail protein [Cupriavidus pauculus]